MSFDIKACLRARVTVFMCSVQCDYNAKYFDVCLQKNSKQVCNFRTRANSLGRSSWHHRYQHQFGRWSLNWTSLQHLMFSPGGGRKLRRIQGLMLGRNYRDTFNASGISIMHPTTSGQLWAPTQLTGVSRKSLWNWLFKQIGWKLRVLTWKMFKTSFTM